MNPLSLIPTPDSIPAPAWIFLALDIFLFTIHILLINMALGSILIILFRGLGGGRGSQRVSANDGAARKIPSLFALGINFGVAPLLFMQVIYGHLFYSSSVLMAVYWILIIPFLIVAYYGAYIFANKSGTRPLLARGSLWAAAFIVLSIGLMFVNNMTLMLQPEKWTVYFENRGGIFLNFSDSTLIPRYLHFVTASVAVGGLFMAFLAKRQAGKGITGAGGNRDTGLKIYGYATVVQILIGMWFLITIPTDYLLYFMGRDPFSTIVFLMGLTGALGSAAAAFAIRLHTTGILFAITIAAMILTRHNLRTVYLNGKFSLNTLHLNPQYGVMALFVGILIFGILAVIFMVKVSSSAGHRRVAE